jgi:hypothetical protein
MPKAAAPSFAWLSADVGYEPMHALAGAPKFATDKRSSSKAVMGSHAPIIGVNVGGVNAVHEPVL